MRPAGVLVLCSLVFCAGTWLAIRGWRQPHPRLGQAVAHLRRPASTVTVRDTPGTISSVGAFVQRRGATKRTQAWTQPLRLVDRSVELHLGYLVLAAIWGLILPTLVLGVL